MFLALRVSPSASAPEAEDARVTRVVQGIQSDGVSEFLPDDLARTGLAAFGELQAVPAKGLDRRPRRPHPLERGEEHAQTLLHLLVGFQNHMVVLVIDQADRQRHF